MKTKADHLLSDEQKDKIHQAVVQAEARSSGEIVPVILDQSGHYTEFSLTGAILVTFLTAAIALGLFPRLTAIQLLIIELVLFWVCFRLIQGVPIVWHWLIPDSLVDKVVAQRAREVFYAHRLHETRERNGILILLSLLEHRVELLADTGISGKVPQQSWQGLVDEITAGMKKGEPFDALYHAIDRCGALLAAHFPRRPDDTDELPNLVTPPDEGRQA